MGKRSPDPGDARGNRVRGRLATVVVVGALGACGGADGGVPEIADARVGAPAGPNAALYFTAIGGDESDRLLGASTTVASEIQIHETTVGEEGTMGMRPLEGLDLPPGATLTLEPGGLHLMLIDVERLRVGDEIDVTLVWENGGERTISADVVDPGETMNHDG